MGRARIPAHPGGVFLEDRADGTVWLLTSNGDYVGLTDAYLRAFSSVQDSVDIGTWRVFATGGRLGMETARPRVVDAPLHTHSVLPSRVSHEIEAYADERLSYEQVAP